MSISLVHVQFGRQLVTPMTPPALHSCEHLKESTPKRFGRYRVIRTRCLVPELLFVLLQIDHCDKLDVGAQQPGHRQRWEWKKYIAMTMTAGLVPPRQPHHCLEMFGSSCETLQTGPPRLVFAPSNQENKGVGGKFNWAHGHVIVSQRVKDLFFFFLSLRAPWSTGQIQTTHGNKHLRFPSDRSLQALRSRRQSSGLWSTYWKSRRPPRPTLPTPAPLKSY